MCVTRIRTINKQSKLNSINTLLNGLKKQWSVGYLLFLIKMVTQLSSLFLGTSHSEKFEFLDNFVQCHETQLTLVLFVLGKIISWLGNLTIQNVAWNQYQLSIAKPLNYFVEIQLFLSFCCRVFVWFFFIQSKKITSS